MSTKTCKNCQQVKPFSEFTRRAALADGYVSKCKQCKSNEGIEKRRVRSLAPKICAKCGVQKMASDFYPHPCSADGFTSDCKSCSVKHSMDWNSKHPFLARKHHRNWCQSDQGKEKLKALAERYPERQAARVAAKAAMQSGLLKSQPCLICGRKAEAHHPDYSRPLDVVWLCRKHHLETHYMIRPVKHPEFTKMIGNPNVL